MSVDLSKIRVGDQITVGWLKVREIGLNDIIWCEFVETNGPRVQYMGVLPENVATHTPAPPKPLQVGDKVKHKRTDHQYIVVAPPRKPSDWGEQVALWSDDNGYGSEYVRQLERVEP